MLGPANLNGCEAHQIYKDGNPESFLQRGLGGAETQIRSLDEVPEVAHLAARQQFLRKWYKPVALAPFTLFLFVSLKFFSDTDSAQSG